MVLLIPSGGFFLIFYLCFVNVGVLGPIMGGYWPFEHFREYFGNEYGIAQTIPWPSEVTEGQLWSFSFHDGVCAINGTL